MKRLIVYCFCLVSFSCWAQFTEVEFLAGPNYSNLRSNQVNPGTYRKATYTGKVGVNAGLGTSLRLSKRFSLVGRLLYQRTVVQGYFPFRHDYLRGNLDLTTYFDKLNIPITLRYTIGDKLKFSGELGGYVNYYMNATARDYTVYGDPDQGRWSEQYKTFDLGLTGLVALTYPLNPKTNIRLSVSNNYGLTNITPLKLFSVDDYIKSNTWNLFIGIVHTL